MRTRLAQVLAQSLVLSATLSATVLAALPAQASIGQRFPAERKLVKDPVTGTMLTFLTSRPHGDAKIYQTHPQWTADGQWLIFRSGLAHGEAMAVNENSGAIVQVTEGGYDGMLNAAQHSMRLVFLRRAADGRQQVVEVDLARVFADSAAGQDAAGDQLPARRRDLARGRRRRHGARRRRAMAVLP